MDGTAPGVYLAALALAVACASLLVSYALRHARSAGMLVAPGARQSHSEPTPTGAGAGLVLAAVIVSLLTGHYATLDDGWRYVVLPGLVLLSAIGWLDDRYSVSALLRLLVQFSVSFSLLGWIDHQVADLNWWIWPAGALSIVWVMNAYNFMDGSHGMAGFQGVFCGLVLFGLFLDAGAPGLALPALVLAGACLGFLPLNFPAARIFMGDSGSVPLGFAFAALIGLGVSLDALPLAAGALVLSVFLVDSGLTLVKRVFQGERWYTAHKQHVYQRLIDQGWPHSRVLLLYQAINLIVVAPVIMLTRTYPNLACVLAGVTFLLLMTGWYAASLRLEVRK